MKQAVAYCRVSTDGQVGEDKFGIESQKQMIREYSEKHDIEITDWFIDLGVSGASKKRPALDRLLSGEVSNPPIGTVLVAKSDRLARDVSVYYSYKGILQDLNIELISVVEDWSMQDKLTAMILENFLAVSATIERENIRIRTSGGRKMKSRNGGYSGGRPSLGYKTVGGRLVIVEEEAKVVRFIFAERDSGNTIIGIRDKCNELGYKTKYGKNFAISTVQSVLNNRKLYEGMYKYGKDMDWVQGVHEPILK